MVEKKTEGLVYAEVLQNFKTKVNLDTHDVKIWSFRKIINKNDLFEIGLVVEGSFKLFSSIKDTGGEGANVSKLVSRIEVEILNLDATIDAVETRDAVR